MVDWQPVVGLELHMQLATKSKLFSSSRCDSSETQPNKNACNIDLGMPGVLPVLNKEAVRMAVAFGLAVGGQIAEYSVFERKNYFYPDLPKGYQISQNQHPIVSRGQVEIEDNNEELRVVHLEQAHLEEDAGKSLHDHIPGHSAIDMNRAGVPLLEVVSMPEMYSSQEAVSYMRKVYDIGCYLGICDGNMQEGSLRCDANVSVRPSGSTELGVRNEIKNINSFRFVGKAIEYEISRQIEVLESGGQVRQQTRLYDSVNNTTRPMRSKEEANDYRYFPDPDLYPVCLDEELIRQVRETLPMLKEARRRHLEGNYRLSTEVGEKLVSRRQLADFFEDTANACCSIEADKVAHWLSGFCLSVLKAKGVAIEDCRLSPETLAKLLDKVGEKEISAAMAKDIFRKIWDSGKSVDEAIAEGGLHQIGQGDELVRVVSDVIAENPQQVQQYQQGKRKVLGFFVGRVLRKTKGMANPQETSRILQHALTTAKTS